MSPKKTLPLLLIPLLLLGSCGRNGETLTAWMPRAEFAAFLAEKDKKGEDGKNFWGRGCWVESAESRWVDGWQQYRLKISQTPKAGEYAWMWLYDMEKPVFEKKLTEMSLKGFQMVSMNKCVSPSGVTVFAAVWHKTVAKK